MTVIDMRNQTNTFGEYLQQYMRTQEERRRDKKHMEAQAANQRLAAAVPAILKQLEAIPTHEGRVRAYQSLPPEYQAALIDPSRVGRTVYDDIADKRGARLREAYDGESAPARPADAIGSVREAAPISFWSAIDDPRAIPAVIANEDPGRAAFNREMVWTDTTDKQPTQWQSERFTTDATQGPRGVLEANRIGTGQDMNAHQRTTTAETNRHNVVGEGETNRHHVAGETETTRYHNLTSEEVGRHNRAGEGETKRHNTTTEGNATPKKTKADEWIESAEDRLRELSKAESETLEDLAAAEAEGGTKGRAAAAVIRARLNSVRQQIGGLVRKRNAVLAGQVAVRGDRATPPRRANDDPFNIYDE
jgi:hypothetical protein